MKIICTITDKDNPAYKEWLLPSCINHKLQLVPLIYKSDYRSHQLKDYLLLEYLKSFKSNEIIFFTDAYDTILLASEGELLAKYNLFRAPLVFSAEVNCWPDISLAKTYPENINKLPLKYLNSGGFIGESDYIKYLIEKYYYSNSVSCSKYIWSNQYIWHHIFLKEQPLIKLDHFGDLFYTLSTDIRVAQHFVAEKDQHIKAQCLEMEKKRILEKASFVNGRLEFLETGNLPCHVHFNSPLGKDLMKGNFFNSLKIWQQELHF